MSETDLAPALTTGEIARRLNQVLGVRCYTRRDIRLEVDAGRLPMLRPTRRAERKPILVHPHALLVWAASELSADDLARLRQVLAARAQASGQSS